MEYNKTIIFQIITKDVKNMLLSMKSAQKLSKIIKLIFFSAILFCQIIKIKVFVGIIFVIISA